MNYGLDNGMHPFFGGGFGFIAIIFLFILAILWFLLPFAIFGTKGKLDDIKSELQDTNQKLQMILNEMGRTLPNDKESNGNDSEHITATRD